MDRQLKADKVFVVKKGCYVTEADGTTTHRVEDEYGCEMYYSYARAFLHYASIIGVFDAVDGVELDDIARYDDGPDLQWTDGDLYATLTEQAVRK